MKTKSYKRYSKKLQYLIYLFIFSAGMLFTFQRCQKEETVTVNENQNEKYRSEILTYKDLLSKEELSTPLSLLSKVLDVNVKGKAAEDSFVIKTSEIISLTTDYSQTYTFKIAKPTLTTSIFEYFVIDMSDVNTPKYFITRFTPKADATDGEFPFDVTFQNLSEYQIEISDYEVHLTKTDIPDCVSIYYDIHDTMVLMEPTLVIDFSDCFEGGSDSDTSNNTSSDTSNDTSSDTNNDSNFTSDNTSASETVTSGGGGGTTTTTTTSSNYPAPIGIRIVDYPDVLADVLNYLYNGVAPASMIDWVYNDDNFLEVTSIMKFLINNNYSAKAMAFVWQAVVSITNGNITNSQLTNLIDYYNIYNETINTDEIEAVFNILNSNLSENEKINQLSEYFEDSTPIIDSVNQSDYETAILNMTNYMKQFGYPNYVPIANYIESLIPEFMNFTMGDVVDVYHLTRNLYNGLRVQYFFAVTIPFAEAAIPFLQFAIIDATLGAALPIIAKIPSLFVSRGAKLEAMILETTTLGEQGTQFVRILNGQSSAARAEALFAKLTEDAINVTNINTPSGLLIQAEMGNGNYIVLRYFSTTNPTAYAVLEYNYVELLGTNSFEIKFLP